MSTLEIVCVIVAGALAAYHTILMTAWAVWALVRQAPEFTGRTSVICDPRWLFLYTVVNVWEFWVSWALGYEEGLLTAASVPLVAAQVALMLEAYSRLSFIITAPNDVASSSRFNQLRIGLLCATAANGLAMWDTLQGDPGVEGIVWIWVVLNVAAIAFYIVAWGLRARLAASDAVAYGALWGIALATVVVLAIEWVVA